MLIAIACTSCTKQLNPAYCAAHPTDPRCDGVPIDAMTDAPGIDAPPVCIGEGVYQVCLDPTGLGPVNLAVNVNTGTVTQCLATQPVGWMAAGQPEACVIAGTDVTLSAMITGRGPRPLVIVATNSLTIAGTLDVSAKKDKPNTIPAGFVAAACPSFAQAPSPSVTGAGGAAGGSLSTQGGNGGTGDGATARAAGFAASIVATSSLRAGCGGQTGAMGDTSGAQDSAGGNGGGAVYLIAGGAMSFVANAQINASGAGGSGGGHHSGGGGGGSGGMIVLWAQSISIDPSVTIFANGGGGASGGPAAQNGNAGNDPSVPATPAGGGNGAGNNAGGTGAAGASPPTSGGNANAGIGGGGGGGGLGYIQSNHALTGAQVSPPEALF